MKYTVIMQMSSGQYYVGYTATPKKLLQDKRKEVVDGFFHQKKNLGNAKIVFCVEGDFRRDIKRIGAKTFMSIMDAYDPFIDFIGQIQ